MTSELQLQGKNLRNKVPNPKCRCTIAQLYNNSKETANMKIKIPYILKPALEPVKTKTLPYRLFHQ